jgi:drug/metabolite transporter (DMT)-like permease
MVGRGARAVALIATLALLWGSGFFWIALSLDGFTPVQLTFLRLALGALVLVPIVLIRRLARPRGWRIWGHLTISALIGNAIPYTLFGIAQQTVPSSLAGVINATTPLWTVLIATAARTEGPLDGRRAFGVGLGFVGVLVLFEPWNATTGAQIGGVLACLGAAASYGLAYVYQGRFLTNRGLAPLTLTAAQLVVAAAILAAALPFGGGIDAEPPVVALVAVLVLGAVGTGIALVINFTLIASEGPTTASVVTYLVPIVAVALGVLVLHEPARLTLPISAALILVGVALVRRSRTVREEPAPAGEHRISRPDPRSS